MRMRKSRKRGSISLWKLEMKFKSVLQAVLLSAVLVLPTAALPAARASLHKSVKGTFYDFEIADEQDDEPLYAYVYEYEEENSNQIWSDCSKDQSVMKIEDIELDPNPPQKGEPVTVSVNTKLYEEVDGGTVSVLVKYSDIITVIKKTFSICQLTAAVLKSCPIEEGNHKIVVTETFPSYAPSGTYVGTITAKDSSGRQIACVSIDITLGS